METICLIPLILALLYLIKKYEEVLVIILTTLIDCVVNWDWTPLSRKVYELEHIPKQTKSFRIGLSKVAGAGVYAKRDVPKNTIMMFYTGDITTKLGSAYVMCTNKKNVYIDAQYRGNMARYVNHGCGKSVNVYGYAYFGYAIFISCKRISEGEELYFNYGPDYGIKDCYCIDCQ